MGYLFFPLQEMNSWGEERQLSSPFTGVSTVVVNVIPSYVFVHFVGAAG